VLGGCGCTAAHLQRLGARLQLVQHLLLADLRYRGIESIDPYRAPEQLVRTRPALIDRLRATRRVA
jgi:hypothetical protein